jgi:hypothetical protein
MAAVVLEVKTISVDAAGALRKRRTLSRAFS